ncbi:MAG: hypothetical protein ABSH34_37340, partial [Verrucomicrobiota bacterium]
HCASHSSKIAAVQTRINPTILRENRALPPQNPAKIAPKCQIEKNLALLNNITDPAGMSTAGLDQ